MFIHGAILIYLQATLSQLVKIFLAFLLTFILSSCSSMKNPVIYQTTFDFSQVKTYGFPSTNTTWFTQQNLHYSQRNRIEIAIETNLQKQGFIYSDKSDPDIIVTYYLIKNQSDVKFKTQNPYQNKARNKAKSKEQDYKNYNKSVLFCTHCLKANTWQQENNTWVTYPGGLIIDLVDPKRKRSIWRSIYPLNLDEEDNSAKQNTQIKEAVDVMLFQYPDN